LSTGSAAPTGFDSCVVGTWQSTTVSGTLTNSNGSVSIPLSGGGGEIAVIQSDGSIGISYKATSPETGKGTDGARYTVSFKGKLSGQLSTSNGTATFTINDPRAATQTIARDGTVVAQTHPPTQEQTTYTCTPGQALTVTTSGITTHWVPA
jgi:hypothetical protein